MSFHSKNEQNIHAKKRKKQKNLLGKYEKKNVLRFYLAIGSELAAFISVPKQFI